MLNTTLELKESKRTRRYNQDLKVRPVKMTFNIEHFSHEVQQQTRKLANNESCLTKEEAREK